MTRRKDKCSTISRSCSSRYPMTSRDSRRKEITVRHEKGSAPVGTRRLCLVDFIHRSNISIRTSDQAVRFLLGPSAELFCLGDPGERSVCRCFRGHRLRSVAANHHTSFDRKRAAFHQILPGLTRLHSVHRPMRCINLPISASHLDQTDRVAACTRRRP
jgi:hypothetical protein